MIYRTLTQKEISPSLFAHFQRHQTVNKCWRKAEDGSWTIKEDPFIDDWSEEDYQFLVSCLKHTIATGGIVIGAFEQEQLKGFVSVEADRMGSQKEYLDLTSIHISEDMRRKGIGRELFFRAAQWAREHGGKKLYISAHSAVETQAFYRALGCTEAVEYQQSHVAQEPYDVQMEYVL